MSSIFDWDPKSPTNNQTADIDIDWREGMLPSNVNTSACVMMERIAQFLGDWSGYIDLSGSPIAYSGICSSQFATYITKLRISIKPAVNNAAGATLTLNNIASKPLVKRNGNRLVLLSENDLIAGDVYDVRYIENSQFKDGAFRVLNIDSLDPVGMIRIFPFQKNMAGWMFCDGRELERSAYPNLFAEIGTIWGEPTKNTLFKIPDFRGVFLRGVDDNRGLDTGRKIGTFQKYEMQTHTHYVTIFEAGAHNHEIKFSWKRVDYGSSEGVVYDLGQVGNVNKNTLDAGTHTHNATIKNTGGVETRPSNCAIAYYIKI